MVASSVVTVCISEWELKVMETIIKDTNSLHNDMCIIKSNF